MDNENYPLGALRDPKDERDILLATVSPDRVDLPRKFSVRDQQSKVVRQKFGSCVGFANKSAMEHHRKRLFDIDEELSGRAEYAFCKQLDGRAGDEGTWPRIGLSVAFGTGLVLEKDHNNSRPSNSNHAEYIELPNPEIVEGAIQRVMQGGFVLVRNLQELKQAIVKHGAVLVSITVWDNFYKPEKDGFVGWKPNRERSGGHAVLCTGFDDDFRGVGALEIKNSWGESWGDDGYCYLAYNYDGEGTPPCHDMWAIVGDDMVNSAETSGAPIAIGYPVETPNPVITQGFGARPEYYKKYGMNGHNGLDFRTIGTSRYIIACDDGEVIVAGNQGSYGLTVRINHSWGQSIYGHNSQLLVSTDGEQPMKVKKGQRIAVAGSTGDSSAEHCHFSIRINGVKNSGYFDWVDPTPYFRKATMTKYFRVLQNNGSGQNKAGIMILEGFSGTILFENDYREYQDLLKITAGTENAPIIEIPAGQMFKIDDGGKLGVATIEGFSGSVLFENDWNEYGKLLQITGVPNNAHTIVIPS